MSRHLAGRRLIALVALLTVVGLAVAVWADDDGPTGTALAAARVGSTTTVRPPTSTTAPPTTVAPTVAPTTAAPASAAPSPFGLVPPAPGGDPASLAAQIVAAEAVLREPTSAPDAVAEAALAQQVAYRHLGRLPEWDEAVLAAVPPELRGAVHLNTAARRQFQAMHRKLSSTLPAWRIVPPEPLEQLQATYVEAGNAFGIPWPYLAAIHLVETGTGRIRGTSTAGAQGPMQFMPATWAAYGGGGDINSTRDAIFGAARYLAANGGANDLPNALWHYNHSDFYVLGVQIYADLIAEHPNALRAYYHWGIWYITEAGDRYLPVGYDEPVAKPVQ